MPEGAASLDTALERLYSAPLSAFVSERKAIARELRTAGDRDGARAIEKTQRPSVAAWTLNQLARRHPRALGAFLDCVDRQLAGALEAREDEKRALAQLLEHTREILESDGHAPSRTNIERITRALRSAAVDAEARAALERGRLAGDPEPGDALDVLAAIAPAAASSSPKTPEMPKQAPKDRPKEPRKPDNAFARSARAHASRSPADVEDAERRAALQKSLAELHAERRALAARLERIDDEIATLDRRLAELKTEV